MHWGWRLGFVGFWGQVGWKKMDVILSANGLYYSHPCEQWFFFPLQFYTVPQVTVIHKKYLAKFGDIQNMKIEKSYAPFEISCCR